MGTTTIEIRDDQQEALSDLKQHDRESYKSVLDRLLEADTGETQPTVSVAEGFEWSDEDVAEITNQLQRIESGVREATNAAQSADKKLEGLGR